VSGFRCSRCDWTDSADHQAWRCASCGSPIELDRPALELNVHGLEGDGVWRYSDWIGVGPAVTLGEVRTPLVTLPVTGSVQAKNDSLLPTGSFKDRGASVLVAWLLAHGAKHIVLDSSGNSGAAHAAYAARAGLTCEIYAPSNTSSAKLAQARAYGARVCTIDGPRAASSRAAQEAAARLGASYASHQWHPAFLAGTETIAFELWEQCEVVPTAVILPVGAGTLLLGVARGFQRLEAAGVITAIPRLIGIQAQGCAPIARALGCKRIDQSPGPSVAEGIQVVEPPRLQQIVAAIRDSGGTALTVHDEDILEQHRRLARYGVLVEPTAAAAAAGLYVAQERGLVGIHDSVVAILTGSGLKTLDRWPTASSVASDGHDRELTGST
jgi:threonine synthase